MSKFLISIIGTLIIGEAFATGENIPTSKSYVDTAVATKQDKISANDGTTQVLTNTGVAGEYGTKGIYDANGEYATQTQNLVDAATMNAGVQNAIDSEFQCIEYDNHGECLLVQLSNQNLFNPTINTIEQGTIASDGGSNARSPTRIRTRGYINVFPNKTYKIDSNTPRVYVLYYDENGEFLHKYSGWQNIPYIFKTANDTGKIRMVLSISDQIQITPLDLEYLTIEIYNNIHLPFENKI